MNTLNTVGKAAKWTGIAVFILFALAAILLAIGEGCAPRTATTTSTTTINVEQSDRAWINVTVENPYDLKIQAWDRRVNGAYHGAIVTVLDSGSLRNWSKTGLDGWTEPLATPANAQKVKIVVEWQDLHGFHHSYSRWIRLQHQTVTFQRVAVNTTPGGGRY